MPSLTLQQERTLNALDKRQVLAGWDDRPAPDGTLNIELTYTDCPFRLLPTGELKASEE